MNHLEIMKICYENERKRVLDKARELVRELESSAKMITRALEEGDLNRIAWLTRTYDVELSTRTTVLHENLHLIASLPSDAPVVADSNGEVRCAVSGCTGDHPTRSKP